MQWCVSLQQKTYLLHVHSAHGWITDRTFIQTHDSDRGFELNVEIRRKNKFIQIKGIWYYNVYIHKLKL